MFVFDIKYIDIDFELQYNDVHRFVWAKHDISSILSGGIISSILLKKTPSGNKFENHAARAARAASAIGLFNYCQSDVIA